MGNCKEEGKEKEEMKLGLGRNIGKAAAAALGFTVSLECTSIQPSLHLITGLTFDDSAASRLPGEIWPTV